MLAKQTIQSLRANLPKTDSFKPILSLCLSSVLALSMGSATLLNAQDLEPLQRTEALNAPTLSAGNAKSPSGAPLSAKVEFYANRYLIGPGDVLTFKVLREPDYNQEEVLVRPDGTATFAGVGELYVHNATVGEVTEMLKERLKDTLVEPEVLLTVANTRPVVVYLAGAVTRPGMMQFYTNPNDKSVSKDSNQVTIRTETRLFNVLANGGGVQMDADLSRVTIKRGKGCQVAMHDDPNACEPITVNMWNLLQSGEADNDIMLYSGDSVHVARLPEMAMSDEQYDLLLRSDIGPKKFPVRVLGQVNNPGVIDLDGQSALLNTAIARAGGFKEQANLKVLALRRFSGPSTFTTVFIDASKHDFMLRPNDVLYIPETKLAGASRVMDHVAKVLSPFNSIGVAAMGGAQAFAFGAYSKK